MSDKNSQLTSCLSSVKDYSAPTWKVYMIQAKSGKIYTGITNNLERRLKQHLTRKKGASFFYFSEPEKIVFYETCFNRSEASKKENQIKKLSRQEKLKLIHAFLNQKKDNP